MKIALARGIHYRSPIIYQFFTALKLRRHSRQRYHIAARYIRDGESVLDVCAGFGEFKGFLPASCTYQAIEASPSFNGRLFQKAIACQAMNLHEGIDTEISSVDVITMIISLCQFKETSAGRLLDDFKKMARRVVIVEDVLPESRKTPWLIEKVRDYLCATEYYRPMRLFSAGEFEAMMRRHGYQCHQYNERYWVGSYPS